MTLAPLSDRRPPLTLAVIGPQRHGKSLLAVALSQALWDLGEGAVSYEALTRGGRVVGEDYTATIEPRWLEVASALRRYVLLDLSGDTRYPLNQLAPLAWADAALVVVSASRGSTAEGPALAQRLRIARHFGARRAVACLTMCDEVEDEELLDLAETELRERLSDCGYAPETPVIRAAARASLAGDPRWQAQTLELAAALDDWLEMPVRDAAGPLELPVLRSYPIAGRGAVAAVKVARGSVRAGEVVELLGTPRERREGAPRQPLRAIAEVGSLRSFERRCQVGRAGELLGALLLTRRERHIWNDARLVTRGLLIAPPGSVGLHDRLRAELTLHAPLAGEVVCRMLLRTGHERARFRVAAAAPGEVRRVELELGSAVPLAGGERFALRRAGELIGLGVALPPEGPGIAVDPVYWS